MARKGITGYATLVDPALSGKKERDTFTCAHCQNIRHVQPGNSPYAGVGDLCYGCDKPVCEVCAAELAHGKPCQPFEERLKAFEAKHAALRSYGLE